MAGFPDIRLYKSDYTAEEAKNISKEKGSIVFSTKTKRLYVAKEQFGSNIQDILWKPDTDNRKFKLEINKDDAVVLSYYYKKLIVDNGKCKDYSTPDDINENIIIGDFYTLRNWFKKRNYLK